jgi:Domain of unknown function (DUF5979)/Thioester domain
LGLISLTLALIPAAPAGAVARSKPPGLTARAGTNTDMIMGGTSFGQGVTGFIANSTNPFDPVGDGYPTSNPTTGFTPKNEGFAGIILGNPVDGSPQLSLYCFDINTDTWGGIGYTLGTWDAANVPNVGYVARILSEYYPFVPNQPSQLLGNTNAMAAAVQAAIWFFSDRYVLDINDPLRPTVVTIVDHIRAEGPFVNPPPPSLSISPTNASGPNTGAVVGPYTVTSGTGSAVVNAVGANMFSDPAGTVPIAQGAPVTNGEPIFLRSTGTMSAVLQASAKATVPQQNVYIYDGNTSGVGDAQRLMLALPSELTTTVSATADFASVGQLLVKKTITGSAAGQQGQVTIHTVCDGVPQTPDFIVASRSPAGTYSRTYTGISTGSICTVTETADGQTGTLVVKVTGDGQQVPIPENGTATVEITDNYFRVGSLLVRKTIAGPQAGHQGEIVIHSVCNGTALAPDFVIPAGTPQGDKTQQYDDIPTPASCTVTETVDGHTSTVSVIVEGSGQTVPLVPDEVVEADLSDTYAVAPGSLVVSKTIAGTQAGKQGQITIHSTCNGAALTPDFIIPALAPAGVVSFTYSPIPAGAVCTVTETVDGSSSTVSAVVHGSPQTVDAIQPGDEAAADVVDVYGPANGSLLVSKLIGGSQAGHQGPVTIHAVCNGTALSPDFVIPAGTPPGTVVHSFDNVPGNSVCTVTETSDGSASPITVTVIGGEQQAIVPPGGIAVVGLTDVYELDPGSLLVSKSITGSAAGQQGEIAILVSCGGTDDFAFTIAAGTGAGSVSRSFDGLPPGAVCTVTETSSGQTSGLTVATVGSGQQVTVPANATATAVLADSYATIATGTLANTGPPHQRTRIIDFALVAALLGGVLVLVETRTRRRKRVRSTYRAGPDE